MPRRRPAVRRPALLAAWIPFLALQLGFGSASARGAEPRIDAVPADTDLAEPGLADSADPTASAGSSSFLSRHRRSLLWISAGGAAASAVTAILFRREANDRYDAYQLTADPAAIAELYDEAQHLDEVATGFFIGAEALFVATIYLGFFVEPANGHDAALATSPRLAPVLARAPSGASRLGLAWHF